MMLPAEMYSTYMYITDRATTARVHAYFTLHVRDELANERVARRVPEANPAVTAARHQVGAAARRVRLARVQEGEARHCEAEVVRLVVAAQTDARRRT